MQNQVDISKHPFGLGGGQVISGSVTMDVSGFCYYPIIATTAVLNMSNLASGSALSSSFSAGIPIYGNLIAVTQSSGLAVVYAGQP